MQNSVAGARRDPSDPYPGELQGGAGCGVRGVAPQHTCAASSKPAPCPAGNLNFCSSRLCCNQDL